MKTKIQRQYTAFVRYTAKTSGSHDRIEDRAFLLEETYNLEVEVFAGNPACDPCVQMLSHDEANLIRAIEILERYIERAGGTVTPG